MMLVLAAVIVLQCGPLKFMIEASDFSKTPPTEWKMTYLAGPIGDHLGDYQMTSKNGTLYMGDWPCWPTTHCPGKPETKC